MPRRRRNSNAAAGEEKFDAIAIEASAAPFEDDARASADEREPPRAFSGEEEFRQRLQQPTRPSGRGRARTRLFDRWGRERDVIAPREAARGGRRRGGRRDGGPNETQGPIASFAPIQRAANDSASTRRHGTGPGRHLGRRDRRGARGVAAKIDELEARSRGGCGGRRREAGDRAVITKGISASCGEYRIRGTRRSPCGSSCSGRATSASVPCPSSTS